MSTTSSRSGVYYGHTFTFTSRFSSWRSQGQGSPQERKKRDGVRNKLSMGPRLVPSQAFMAKEPPGPGDDDESSTVDRKGALITSLPSRLWFTLDRFLFFNVTIA